VEGPGGGVWGGDKNQNPSTTTLVDERGEGREKKKQTQREQETKSNQRRTSHPCSKRETQMGTQRKKKIEKRKRSLRIGGGKREHGGRPVPFLDVSGGYTQRNATKEGKGQVPFFFLRTVKKKKKKKKKKKTKKKPKKPPTNPPPDPTQTQTPQNQPHKSEQPNKTPPPKTPPNTNYFSHRAPPWPHFLGKKKLEKGRGTHRGAKAGEESSDGNNVAEKGGREVFHIPVSVPATLPLQKRHKRAEGGGSCRCGT